MRQPSVCFVQHPSRGPSRGVSASPSPCGAPTEPSPAPPRAAFGQPPPQQGSVPRARGAAPGKVLQERVRFRVLHRALGTGGLWHRSAAAAGASGARGSGCSASDCFHTGTHVVLLRGHSGPPRPGQRGAGGTEPPQCRAAAIAKAGAPLAPASAGDGLRAGAGARPRPSCWGSADPTRPLGSPVLAPRLALTAEGCSSHGHQPLLRAETLIKR